MLFGFSRRNVVRPASQKSRRPVLKRRRLAFDSLEDRRMLSGGSLASTPSNFAVNVGPTDSVDNGAPRSVAVDSSGNTVVAWASKQGSVYYNLSFERFTNNGGSLSPAGSPVTVASNVMELGAIDDTNNGVPPIMVARAPNGNFVIVWETVSLHGNTPYYQDTTHAQLYSASGKAIGKAQVVGGSNDDCPFSVAMNNSEFDVLYNVAPKAGGRILYEQSYSSSTGQPVGSAIDLGGGHLQASIAMDPNNDFVVAWTQTGTTWDVYAQPFTSAGTPEMASPITISNTTNQDISSSNVAMDANGDFVVAWEQEALNPDGTLSNVANVDAHQYAFNGADLNSAGTITAAPAAFTLDSSFPHGYSADSGSAYVGFYLHQPGAPIGLAMLPDGGFDLSWTQITNTYQPNGSGGYTNTQTRNVDVARYDNLGSLQQSLQVTSDGTSGNSSAAIDSNNDLIVVWADTGAIDGAFYLDPPGTSSPTTSSAASTASPSGSATAATDAVFAVCAYAEDDDTLA
ncbi:MAG TPA: hypothetical protein VF306_15485 [Pirellulales bacterium]